MNRIFAFILICVLFVSFPIKAVNALNETAVFAGGCFWCLEHDLEKLPGVISVESGYSGGDLINPTYRNHKGHREAVRVSFDSQKISYETLLKAYWRNIDPLDNEGQFCDRGSSYLAFIFTDGENQLSAAQKSLGDASKELHLSKKDIHVQIQARQKFWLAEDYHQDYAELNNIKYNFYRYSCGRDNRLKEVWGKNAGSANPWE